MANMSGIPVKENDDRCLAPNLEEPRVDASAILRREPKVVGADPPRLPAVQSSRGAPEEKEAALRRCVIWA